MTSFFKRADFTARFTTANLENEYVLAHKELQQEDKVFDEWCDKVIAAMEAAKKAVTG